MVRGLSPSEVGGESGGIQYRRTAITEEQLQDLIRGLFDHPAQGQRLDDIWAEFVHEDSYFETRTFGEAQLLTRDKGVVLEVHDPEGVREFQITIIQSR